MDHHIIAALLEAITENIAEKVVHRLSLRGPVKALPRSLDAAPATALPAVEEQAVSQEFLSTREAAALLGVSVKGLEAMRAKGRGPKFTSRESGPVPPDRPGLRATNFRAGGGTLTAPAFWLARAL